MVNTDNFIEALKDIGGGVTRGLTHDVVADTGANILDTILNRQTFSASGDLNPGGSIDMAKLQQEQIERQTQIEHRRLHQMRVKEEMVFSLQEEQTQREIQELQTELKKLAAEMGDVAREVKIASLQQAVKPDKYHVNFFQHLKNLIKALRQKLNDSASWLHTANSRAAQRQGYWGQFKSQGTSFSQNQERTLATQSG